MTDSRTARPGNSAAGGDKREEYMKIVGNKKIGSGFTLIEMIIVMGIIGILAAIFNGVYTEYVARTRVRTAIRNIVLLKKALNNMAGVCQGFPIRDTANVNDMASIMPIVDLTGCQGDVTPAVKDGIDQNRRIYPARLPCTLDSLGNELLHAYTKSTGVKYHSSTLCKSACANTNLACQRGMGENFYHTFIHVSGQDCSPTYGSISGPEFAGDGNYQPGWNYVLLHDSTTTSAVDKPVGVICGLALGYHGETVKIVINTSGYTTASGAVAEGSGRLDTTGSVLPSPCPCGPWCRETTSTKTGCCGPCIAGGVEYKGIGYKF